MNVQVNNAVASLTMLALRLNAEDFHVWVDFSGHVNKVDVRVIAGGWVDGLAQDRTFEATTYLDDVNEALANLAKITRQLTSHHHDYMCGHLDVKPAYLGGE